MHHKASDASEAPTTRAHFVRSLSGLSRLAAAGVGEQTVQVRAASRAMGKRGSNAKAEAMRGPDPYAICHITCGFEGERLLGNFPQDVLKAWHLYQNPDSR